MRPSTHTRPRHRSPASSIVRQEIIIAKAGKPKARLVPLADRTLRKPGGWEGKVWVADDFDEPLPPEVLLAMVY